MPEDYPSEQLTDEDLARSAAREASAISAGWWLLVLLGVLSLAVGVLLIFKPGNSLSTLAVIAGIFILIDGIVGIAAAFSRSTANRSLAAIGGVISAIIGIVLIRHPVQTVAVIGLLVGIWLVVLGVLRLVAAFEERGARAGNLVVAAIELIAGVVIVANPHIGYSALAIILGIALIFNGVATVGLGWLLRGVHEEIRELAR